MDKLIIINMATIMILTLVVSLVSIRGVVSTDVSVSVNENVLHIFEGILLRVLCKADFKYQSVTWFKDNRSIITYESGVPLSESLPALTTSDYFPLASMGFYILSLSNLSIAEHSGIYKCVGTETEEGGASNSDEYSLAISKRMPICKTDNSQLEYLTGEDITLSCYNPIYDPKRSVEWSRSDLENGTLATVTTMDIYSSVLNATIDLNAEMNGTSFLCNATVTENRTSTLTTAADDVLSCALGPVKVYDSPFISITEVTNESMETTRVFSCRITPRPINSELQAITWGTEVNTSYVIVTSDVSSDIIFTDAAELSQIGQEITISCTGTAHGVELSTVYTFDSSSSDNINESIPNQNPALFVIIIVAVVAVLLLFFIFVFIVLVSSIKHCRKSQDDSKSSKTLESNESPLSPPHDSSGGMVLTTLPDGRYQLRPYHVSIGSAGSESIEDETERSPLTPPGIDEDLYDLPPGFTDQPASPASPM